MTVHLIKYLLAHKVSFKRFKKSIELEGMSKCIHWYCMLSSFIVTDLVYNLSNGKPFNKRTVM